MIPAYLLHPAARDEFHDILDYYASIDRSNSDSHLALAFEGAFDHHMNQIVGNPEMHATHRGLVRRAKLTPRFSQHYIAYMVWENRVVVLALGHARRRPYYWRNRIGDPPKST